MSGLSESELFDAVVAETRLEGEVAEAGRAVLAELWTALHAGAPTERTAARPKPGLAPEPTEPTASERLGALTLAAGEPVSEAVRKVLRLGRALAARVRASGAAGAAEAARLDALVDEAAARAADGREEAQAARREGWLSLLTHDIKGRLNIINLNLWLLRQTSGGRDEDKFEKIERAIARTLELVKEVRELNERAKSPAPPRHSASGATQAPR